MRGRVCERAREEARSTTRDPRQFATSPRPSGRRAAPRHPGVRKLSLGAGRGRLGLLEAACTTLGWGSAAKGKVVVRSGPVGPVGTTTADATAPLTALPLLLLLLPPPTRPHARAPAGKLDWVLLRGVKEVREKGKGGGMRGFQVRCRMGEIEGVEHLSWRAQLFSTGPFCRVLLHQAPRSQRLRFPAPLPPPSPAPSPK